MPMSSHSGRPVRKPTAASSRMASVPTELPASTRSKTVGPLSARNTASTKRDENGEDRGGEHQALPSNLVTRASIPPASRSSAPSRTSACTVSTLPLTPVVMVPGVSVIELA